MEERLGRAMLSEEEAEREPCSVKERLKLAMLSEGDAQKGLCYVNERLKEGTAQ